MTSETDAVASAVTGLSLGEERKRNKEAKKQKKAAAREKAQHFEAADEVTSSSTAETQNAEASSSSAVAASTRPSRSGRPNDSPEVQLSKALSYILRHGAAKEGLVVRPDGFISVERVLARPKISKIAMPAADTSDKGHRSPSIEDIVATVRNDKKGRFELKGEGEEELAIRAVQGHSIQEITSLDHISLTLDTLWRLTSDERPADAVNGTLPAGVEILHGTTHDAWDKIRDSGGLSKMKRNHIHLAKGRPGASNVISGMRTSSPVILHIDIVAALKDGISFFIASNGAVLTSGTGDTGVLSLRYIEKAEEAKTGRVLWQRTEAIE